MTGFTRMLNSVGAKPDGLMDEIPTVLVNALDQGSGCRAGTENTCDLPHCRPRPYPRPRTYPHPNPNPNPDQVRHGLPRDEPAARGDAA